MLFRAWAAIPGAFGSIIGRGKRPEIAAPLSLDEAISMRTALIREINIAHAEGDTAARDAALAQAHLLSEMIRSGDVTKEVPVAVTEAVERIIAGSANDRL